MNAFLPINASHSRRAWIGCFLASGLALLPMPAWAGAPAPKQNQAKYEMRFLTGMIDHHAMAVHTGMLCAERAIHPELAELCHEIVATQSSEIATMQTWLQDWYGVTHEPEMTKGGERHMEKLAQLLGEEFEVAFLTMMIRHHMMAVISGTDCLEKAFHADLVELCGNIVESQTEEIETMSNWLCDWYGHCQQGLSRNPRHRHR